ncbi:MAG TPA: hypothetical protein VGT44_01005 [Ktedonobacteraceae bacterium]|nr:hypothetical protein [Ktedonobacteraceae bacterium]
MQKRKITRKERQAQHQLVQERVKAIQTEQTFLRATVALLKKKEAEHHGLL